MSASIIKLTNDDMRAAATDTHALLDEYMQNQRTITGGSEELATQHMQGAAGVATHAKTAEVQTDADNHSRTAQEKALGVREFTDVTEQLQQERASAIMGFSI
ncbi:hypothetical protein BKG82_26450 [Mycobacteroides chelonae]|uniref:Uncharacterized protein n=1 Tax=Mycobacteroides chelonae TaxID=1774 RepID=A0A1S1LHD3_MYCCH|nr:hypothetical protein [Mycobacteroides chelonae]OHU47199.1 hypothetical protein BKG82_26450 [Mycobacteroides chelonae]